MPTVGFKLPPKVNILKTIVFRAKYVTNNTTFRNLFGILLYKGVKVESEQSSRIVLNDGRLEIGVSWTKSHPFLSFLKLGEKAKIIVNGSFRIFERSVIFINKGAVLELGTNSYINSNATIHCFKHIKIGDNTIISEGLTIRDSDNHSITGSEAPIADGIEIGNNVWIGMNVTILKGVKIGNGSVIAAGAVVNKSIPENSLAGGLPAKVIKSGVEWNR